jgi:glycosyltransferase involved in cell wall biosynthesis
LRVIHINPDYPYQALYKQLLQHLGEIGKALHSMYVPLVKGRTHTNECDIRTESLEVVYSDVYTKIDRLLYFPRCSKICKALLRHYNFGAKDIIHCHYLFNSGYVARDIKRRTGTKYITAVRNSDINGYYALSRFVPGLQQIGLGIMLEAEYVVFPSPAYYKKVSEWYVPGRHREEWLKKALIIPNGIEDFWIRNNPVWMSKQGTSEIRALFVGEWTKNKNIETTVEVIDLLRSRGFNASLLIVGDGPNRNAVQRLQATRPDYITTHGWVKDRYELLKIYRSCHIFLMPSFKESFGLVYVEAMSQGLPVVYTRGQGIDGYFEDGVIGCGCHARGVEEITDAVGRIMKDYEDISKNCVEASRRFNWTDIAKEYDRLYRSMIQ